MRVVEEPVFGGLSDAFFWFPSYTRWVGMTCGEEFSTASRFFLFDISARLPYTYRFVRGHSVLVVKGKVPSPGTRTMERDLGSGRNGAPAPKSRVSLSDSNQKS